MAMVRAPMPPVRRLFRFSCAPPFRTFIVVTALVLGAGAAHAQNEPPPLDGPALSGPGVGPGGSAASQAAASAGGLSASVGVLNPHLGGSPLWLWLEAQGEGEVRLVDPSERILWRSGQRPFSSEGQLVIIPRPPDMAIQLEVTDGSSAPVRRDLMISNQRAQQLSLPVLVVGEGESVQLAQRMRARIPDQFVHHILPDQLPVTPAAYLGVRVVVLGPDVVLQPAQALALRLYSCARGGVVSLSNVQLPPKEGCQDPPLLLAERGVPSAAQLLQSIKNFQSTLGLLDERGPSNIWGAVITDSDAAGALLARRPPWQAGVVGMLLSLLALGAAISLALSRKWRPSVSVAVMALAPILGGVLLVAAGYVLARPLESIALTTVDARAGSRVALVHTMEASRKRRAPDAHGRTATAWVSTMEPTTQSKKEGAALPYVTHVFDVVELPVPLSSIPDAADPAEVLVRVEGSDSVRGHSCGKNQVTVSGKDLAGAHGRLLQDKCKTSRGVLAPLQKSWIPSLAVESTDTSSAWVYVRNMERTP